MENDIKENVEQQTKKIKVDIDYIRQPTILKFEDNGEFEIEEDTNTEIIYNQMIERLNQNKLSKQKEHKISKILRELDQSNYFVYNIMKTIDGYLLENRLGLEHIKKRFPHVEKETEDNAIKLNKRIKNLNSSSEKLKEESIKMLEKIEKNEQNYFKDLQCLMRSWNLFSEYSQIEKDSQLFVVCFDNIPLHIEKEKGKEGSLKLFLNKGFLKKLRFGSFSEVSAKEYIDIGNTKKEHFFVAVGAVQVHQLLCALFSFSESANIFEIIKRGAIGREGEGISILGETAMMSFQEKELYIKFNTVEEDMQAKKTVSKEEDSQKDGSNKKRSFEEIDEKKEKEKEKDKENDNEEKKDEKKVDGGDKKIEDGKDDKSDNLDDMIDDDDLDDELNDSGTFSFFGEPKSPKSSDGKKKKKTSLGDISSPFFLGDTNSNDTEKINITSNVINDDLSETYKALFTAFLEVDDVSSVRSNSNASFLNNNNVPSNKSHETIIELFLKNQMRKKTKTDLKQKKNVNFEREKKIVSETLHIFQFDTLRVSFQKKLLDLVSSFADLSFSYKFLNKSSCFYLITFEDLEITVSITGSNIEIERENLQNLTIEECFSFILNKFCEYILLNISDECQNFAQTNEFKSEIFQNDIILNFEDKNLHIHIQANPNENFDGIDIFVGEKNNFQTLENKNNNNNGLLGQWNSSQVFNYLSSFKKLLINLF